jgi:hypothetical protein
VYPLLCLDCNECVIFLTYFNDFLACRW